MEMRHDDDQDSDGDNNHRHRQHYQYFGRLVLVALWVAVLVVLLFC